MKKLLLLIVLFVSVQVQSQVNLTNELLLYYKFDNNTADSSGNGHHGFNHNALNTTDRCGNPNSALMFNGTNSWVTVYPSLPDMERYSIHAWIYYNDTTRNWRGIFSDSDPVVYYDLFLSIKDSLIEIINDKVAGGATGTCYPSKSFFNSWHQLVWVNDSMQQKVYVDTVVVKTFTLDMQNIGYHDSAYVGKMCDGSQSLRFFKGKIDEFRLYTRAINSAEVAALYNLSCGKEVGINEADGTSDAVILFPNPTNDKIFFNAGSLNIDNVKIYNAFGDLVIYSSHLQNSALNISSLLPGIYIAEVQVNNFLVKKKFEKY